MQRCRGAGAQRRRGAEDTDPRPNKLHGYVRHIAVYDPLNAISEMDDVEIEDQAQREAGHFEVGPHLGDVYRVNALDRFYFDDDNLRTR